MGIGKRGDLAKVKLGVFFVGNAFYLDERGVWAGISLSTLVPEDAALGVESERHKSMREGWEGHPADGHCIHRMGRNGGCFCGVWRESIED